VKIAYMRSNQPTELDYEIASVNSLGTDIRLGVLEGLVEEGHQVTITSYIPEKHMHALRGESLGNFDNKWMTMLKYDLDPDMDKFDYLFVEPAATNSMYSFSKDGVSVPFFTQLNNILVKSKGVPIVIIQHGPNNLEFPLGRMHTPLDKFTVEYLQSVSPYNMHNLFTGFDYRDYKWILWTFAASTQHIIKNSSNYKIPDLKFYRAVNTRLGYSPRYDKRFEPRDINKADYDLVFVGKVGTAYREAHVRTYYDTKEYTSLIVGKDWDTIPWSYKQYITTPGADKYHGNVQSHYEKGLACVICVSKDLATSGTEVTRVPQVIQSGCIAMCDCAIEAADRMVGKEFVVGSVYDVCKILDAYCTTQSKFNEIIKYQRSLLPTWQSLMSEVLNG
jgi:hypothetical protein